MKRRKTETEPSPLKRTPKAIKPVNDAATAGETANGAAVLPLSLGEGLRGDGTELTPKAQQTREQILITALALFAEKGYASTTMRDIAAKAGYSLGLTYRYFAAKEDLVLAMYARCAIELAQEVERLPAGSLADRWYGAVQKDIGRLEPFRETMGALFGVALAPGSEIAVLGSRVSEIRETVWNALLQVIMGANDAPRPRQAQELATIAYAAHLSLILFWLQDTSPNQTATAELLKFGRETLGRIRPFLNLPMVTRMLARLAKIIEPMFGAVAGGTK
jgi:AcrR family transcriptional regulator